MFGSKLRSWMENHIVRPRKKGNKNKNSTSNNSGITNNTQNGHKGTNISVYQQNDNSSTSITQISVSTGTAGTTTGTSISSSSAAAAAATATATIQSSAAITTNSISSPARRSEVSPIQSHKTSRFGWQSPKHETTMSPKSDHFLYMHSIKAHTLSSSSSISTNQSNTVQSVTSTSSNSSSLITTNKKTKTLSPNIMFRKSSSSKSSSVQDNTKPISNCQKIQYQPLNNNNSNNSSNIQQQQQQQQHTQSNHHQSSNITKQNYQSNGSDYTIQCLKPNVPSIKQTQYELNTKNNNKNHNMNSKKPSAVIQSSSQLQQHQQQHPQQQQQQQQKIPISTVQQQSYHHNDSKIQQFDENRYGKILPSKRSTNDQFKSSIGSYDNLNANIQFQSKSTEFDDNLILSNANNNNNNNNNSINNGIISTSKTTSNLSKSKNCVNNGPTYIQQLNQHLHHTGQIPVRSGNETNRNIVRTANRYNNNPSIMGPQVNNHPLAHVINSLSSPESAYSTGYSTDGTSPGATYAPPEYYINIRTGTHYFPKTVNSLAIEANRYKFGLNKIEEMSPQEPLPNNHRRTESFDLTQNKIPGFGIPDPTFFTKTKSLQSQTNQPVQPQQTIVLPNFKGFESPSPRQRCRIRTNPWYSTTETSSSGNSIAFLAKKIEIDASSSSSGIKSSSDAGISDKNEKNEKTSESDTTSSSTEVDVHQRTYSPGTIRRKKIPIEVSKSEIHVTHSLHQDSDEDATLNEMMGKFDESYVYEKETDILSDSDPTDCPSDLDTGQDAGDECDTDELLDIDFIDTGSIQEIIEKDSYKNSGSCSYFNYQIDRRASRKRRSRKQNEDNNNSKRKKRLMKTRKKSVESKERNSPIRNCRESRSLGGTPVSLRRNQSADNKKTPKISPLTNRSNSLTFTEIHAIRGRYIAIAESEKALLKADLEADVKYKQLIHEAETILVSMKTGNSALRETNISSPRRICNPPANKRVEILRNCEADIKREINKQTKSPVIDSTSDSINSPPSSVVNKRLEMIKYETNSAPNSPKSGRFSPRKTHITNFINQNAPPPPPLPPILAPYSIELSRKTTTTSSSDQYLSDGNGGQIKSNYQVPLSNSNSNRVPSKSPQSNSPSSRRRIRSQSPRIAIDSDSDTDDDHSKKSVTSLRRSQNHQVQQQNSENLQSINIDDSSHQQQEQHQQQQNKIDINDIFSSKVRQKIRDLKDDLSNKNVVLALEKMSLYDELDYTNRNVINNTKPSLMSFRSIDMGNRNSITDSYCPQSEPLKRKVYKGSSSFERLKKSLDLESEIPKKALLEKISNLRKERQALKGSNPDINNDLLTIITNNSQELKNDNCINTTTVTGAASLSSNLINSSKHQLILNTIEDLKRSLEDQSVELCGLNENTHNPE